MHVHQFEPSLHRINYACDWGKPKLRAFACMLFNRSKRIERFRIWSYRGYVSIRFYFISLRLKPISHIDLRHRLFAVKYPGGYCINNERRKKRDFLIFNCVRYWFHFGSAPYKSRILTSFVPRCKIWIFYLAVISWFVSLVENKNKKLDQKEP